MDAQQDTKGRQGPDHRRLALCVSLALAVAAVSGQAAAHLGDAVYPIFELSTDELPDLHDGTLDDWDAVLPNASLDHNHFQSWNFGFGNPIDPADMALRVFLAWHNASQTIYVGVERLDDVFVPPEPYHDGRVQFMVDGDHSGGQYWFFDAEVGEGQGRRLSLAQAQSYTAIPENPADGRLLLTPDYLAWTTRPPWGDVGAWQYGEQPNVSGMEFYVTPFDDLVYDDPVLSRRTVLEPGRIIGFQLQADDGDEPVSVSLIYILAVPTHYATVQDGSSSFGHSFFTENFVDGELIPCYHGDCSRASTAVQPSSWARIKAAFR